MLGLGDVFEYLECAVCGCLHIREIPRDLSRYYPKNYYSFAQRRHSWFSAYLRNQRTAYKLYGTNLIGMWMCKMAGDYSPLSHRTGWFSKGAITRSSSILDVGCGSGKLLRRLSELGFVSLTGVDPFIAKDIRIGHFTIYKKDLADLEGPFDFVMLHHSFEHMPEPLETLKRIRKILNPRSYALIRIPVVADAWRSYGVNWVQLDAPRHLFLHSVESMRLLADQAGLETAGVVFDSTSYQFLGSEGNIQKQQKQSVDGDSAISRSNYRNLRRRLEFRNKSRELNARGTGDQACFYLRRG